MTPLSQTAVYIGVDVSKDKLDLAVDGQTEVSTFSNDAAGIDQLIERIRPMHPALIVIEATGGYERAFLNAALDARLLIARVQPSRVRHFAKAQGLLAKNDGIDARLLALYARCIQPSVCEKRPKNQVELENLLVLRRQLIDSRTAHTNQVKLTDSSFARATLAELIRKIHDHVKKVNKRIERLIDSDEDLSGRCDLLMSVPGVGKTTAATLAGKLPQLGTINRFKVTALAGLAPYDRESGKWTGKRSIFGGRAEVRSVLYMATVTAIRCNPVIKRFADRLKEAGKPRKVVITACMRKLLTILNAMARDSNQ